MWFIFLCATAVILLALLLIAWIGMKVYASIHRQMRQLEAEDAVFDKVQDVVNEKDVGDPATKNVDIDQMYRATKKH